MKARFLWEMDDHRRRVDDRTREEPDCPYVSAGEWLEPAISPLSGPANEAARRASYPGWVPDDVGIPTGLRRGFAHQQEDVRGAGRLNPIARQLDELSRELDQRVSETRESGRAAIKALVISMAPERDQRRNQKLDRGPFERVETGALERGRKFAGAPYEWIASHSHERDKLGPPADHFSISAFDPVQPPIRSARMGLVNTRSPRSTIAPFARAGLEAVSPIVKPELPPRAWCKNQASDDACERPAVWRGPAHQEEEFEAIKHLNSIMRRLDELARELDERESDATDADIEAFKHRLTALAREIDQRPLPEAELDETVPDETDEYFNPRAGQLEPRASHAGDRGDFDKVGRRGLPAVPPDQRQNEALTAGLSAINAFVNSMAPRCDPDQSQAACPRTARMRRDSVIGTRPAISNNARTMDRKPGPRA